MDNVIVTISVAVILVILVIIVRVCRLLAEREYKGVDLSPSDDLAPKELSDAAKAMRREEPDYYYEWLFGRMEINEGNLKKMLNCSMMRAVDYKVLNMQINDIRNKNLKGQDNG